MFRAVGAAFGATAWRFGRMALGEAGRRAHSPLTPTDHPDDTMLKQILIQTPLFVWAILAFLVYRGIMASKDRLVSYRSVFIMPAAMLALGLYGTASAFGLANWAGAAWLASLALGAALTWVASRQDERRSDGMVMVRGSWMPMLVMLAIFSCKYAVGVALAVKPSLHADMAFALPACILVGLSSGYFVGRLLATITGVNKAYLAAQAN